MSKKMKLPKLTDDQVNFLKIAGVGLGIYLVYKSVTKATKSVKEFFTGDEQNEEDLISAVNKEQKELIDKGETLTYGLSRYQTFARQLKTAMKGIGTDIDLIYKVFGQLKNDLDVTQVIKDYGIQTYYLTWKNIYETNMDLASWIEEELYRFQIKKLNEILEKNNITYRF